MSRAVFLMQKKRLYQQLRLPAFLLIITFQAVFSQTIPIGQWETHFNYLSAKHVLKVQDRIFCASYNGLFSINPNQEIKIWSKVDGLTENGISSFAYDEQEKLLILAYRSGNLDFVTLDEESNPVQVETLHVLNETTGLPENKAIGRIILKDGLAYLCTSFGIVLLDISLKQVDETYRYIGANGVQVNVTDIAFSSDSLFALTSRGLLATSMDSSVNRQYFANWKQKTTPGITSAVAVFNNTLYAGVSGLGLFRKEGAGWKSIYASNSKVYSFQASETILIATLDKEIVKLENNDTAVRLKDPAFKSLNETLLTATDIYWTADDQNGLLTNKNSSFHSITPAQQDTTISPRADSSVIDLAGLNWTRLPQYLGGGILVKNTQTQQQRVLATSIGNGSLPSSVINSLALDNDGYIWFASDKGAGYIIPKDILEGGRVDAILPIYGQRKLFSTEKCTSITVEPGNRKWIGTRTGLFLFNTDGTELIQKFTESDSPLPSDQITALRFETATGILFVDTPNGLVSYRSNSSDASEDLKNVTIFPNPVRPGYGGLVGIKGVTQESTIKITTLSGRLIYQARSEGGTASWNLTDYTGRRARGGIYMVFVVSGDGKEKLVGKLAVVE